MNVRCQNKKFDVIIGIGEFIDNDNYAHALYRVDTNEVVEGKRWLLSTDGTAIFADDKLKVRLASDLANGKSKAVFKVYNYKRTSFEMRINLKGSTKSITQVMKDCNLGSQKLSSQSYKCISITDQSYYNFRVDRNADNQLVGVQADSPGLSYYFQNSILDNGNEVVITLGTIGGKEKIYLNYKKMTARQARLFVRTKYVCE